MKAEQNYLRKIYTAYVQIHFRSTKIPNNWNQPLMDKHNVCKSNIHLEIQLALQKLAALTGIPNNC